jgi:hypothetical protein
MNVQFLNVHHVQASPPLAGLLLQNTSPLSIVESPSPTHLNLKNHKIIRCETNPSHKRGGGIECALHIHLGKFWDYFMYVCMQRFKYSQ